MHTSNNDLPAARVLVIDDEAAVCRVVTRLLESRGFIAEGVIELEAIEGALKDGLFDIILLDRSVAKKSNNGLLAELRKAAPTAKILFFTGELVPAHEEAMVDGIIQKPVNGRELEEALRRLLEKQD